MSEPSEDTKVVSCELTEDEEEPEPPLVVPIGIEDPSGRALQAFHAALRRAQQGEGQARIAFYGASHVASDLYTGVVRARLQARFGDGGAGFVLPAKPFRAYRHAGIEHEPSVGFSTHKVKARAPESARYGLAGMHLLSSRKPAAGAFATRSHFGLSGHASRFELYYLKQPEGGHVRVAIDGVSRELSTRSVELETGYEIFETHDGPHRVEVSTRGDGPVHLFGMVVERDANGVVLDTLGIPGARARYHLFWEDAVYREHLARRRPDLVVLAYGTNESGDHDVPIASYEAEVARVLERIREVVPTASCLLVGPSDRPIKRSDGSYVDRPRTAEIIVAQRRLAARYGCGFFDLVSFMGGPLSMLRWTKARPALGTPDHVHFTRTGYTKLGEALSEALLAGFDAPSDEAEPRSDAAHVVTAPKETPQSPEAAPCSTPCR